VELHTAYTTLHGQAVVLHERVANGQQIIVSQVATLVAQATTLRLYTERWLAAESSAFKQATVTQAEISPTTATPVPNVAQVVEGDEDDEDDEDDEGDDEPGYPSQSYDDDGDFPDGV
jgi:hypothetical protein